MAVTGTHELKFECPNSSKGEKTQCDKCRSWISTTFQLRWVHIRWYRDFSVHQEYVDPAPATILFQFI